MFGTGIFINTIYLAKHAGFLGFLSYLLVALLISPLIGSMSILLRVHPGGGFYTYASHTLGSFAGFASAWAYFIGKLASAALLTHIFTTLVQSMVPFLQCISSLTIDCAILVLFGWLVLYHLKTGTWMIYGFIFCKLLPILFAILSCLALTQHWSVDPSTFLWAGIPSTIPLVLFAFTGFEVCCSLSASIKNPAVNGPRAVAISFIFVVVTTIIYQFLFFLTTGPALLQQTNYLGIFPPLLSLLLPAYWQPKMLAILYAALATASLGGSYGILFSNHWNLYALAQHGHIWGHTLFTQLNIYYIPRLCVLAQIPFCITYLIVTNAQASHLQQISVFGCILAYALSVLGLLAYICQNKSSFIQKSMASLAFISCLFIISLTVRNLMHYGLFSLLIFAIFLLLGISMYATSKTPQN